MSWLQVLTLLLLTTLTIVVASIAENRKNIFNLASPSQFLEDNCVCTDQFNCQCCVQVGGLWVKQNLCANWTISASDWEIRSNVNLNGATLLVNTFFGPFIPPICFPLMPPVALSACMKMHSLKLHENNSLHACANATLRFIAFDFIEILLGCVDIGRNGIQVVSPDHDVEMASFMETTTASAAEITLETSDRVGQNANNTVINSPEVDSTAIKLTI